MSPKTFFWNDFQRSNFTSRVWCLVLFCVVLGYAWKYKNPEVLKCLWILIDFCLFIPFLLDVGTSFSTLHLSVPQLSPCSLVIYLLRSSPDTPPVAHLGSNRNPAKAVTVSLQADMRKGVEVLSCWGLMDKHQAEILEDVEENCPSSTNCLKSILVSKDVWTTLLCFFFSFNTSSTSLNIDNFTVNHMKQTNIFLKHLRFSTLLNCKNSSFSKVNQFMCELILLLDCPSIQT